MSRIAVVGAGGVVGREMLRLLAEQPWVEEPPLVYGSPRSRGQRLSFREHALDLAVLGEAPLPRCSLALFAAGAAVAREWAPRFADNGALVIDNSSAFRMDPEVPLVIPEINAGALGPGPGIVANPNCSTIILLVAVNALRALGRCRIFCATYQAVSGAGRAGLEALAREQAGGPFEPFQPFPFPIGSNLFPLIGSIEGQAEHCTEERKIVEESRRILGDPTLAVYVTCVRVPIQRCHSEAITLLYEAPVSLAHARALLAEAPGVELSTDPARPPLPGPLAGTLSVHVGRVRQPAPEVLQLWAVGDQLLKGAAWNAVQIASLWRAAG